MFENKVSKNERALLLEVTFVYLTNLQLQITDSPEYALDTNVG